MANVFRFGTSDKSLK